MWSSEEEFSNQTKRTVDSNLSFKYLTPSSFKVLRPENQVRLPNLSLPLNPHKISPTVKRKRNAAFSIIAESVSNPVTRSPSPTSGRVSPFRARGFNPTGSRHASPQPSPLFEKKKISTHSKIPKLSRQDSSTDFDSSPSRRRNNFTRQLSQNLSNISPRNILYKPPPNPKTVGRHHRIHAIQKLSPIDGSSPEPSPSQRKLRNQLKSSPSRIPRSRSQPPTRSSDSRNSSRVNSRNASRNVSRNVSREPSPNKFTSKFNYVKAKVNSFNAIKPKVPPKPQVPNFPTRNKHNDSFNNNNDDERSGRVELIKDLISAPFNPELRRIESSTKLNISAHTEAVVSSTTHTVTKPLRIEAKLESLSDDSREDVDKNEDYLPDARSLSATSVSTALNRMNDTVLDTKTVMQDTSLKLHNKSTEPKTSSSVVLSSQSNGTNVQSSSLKQVGLVTIASNLNKGENVSETNKVTNEALVTKENRKVTNDGNKVTSDGNKVTSDGNKVTSDGNKVTNDVNRVTHSTNNLTNEATNVKSEEAGAKSNEANGRSNLVNDRSYIGLSVLPKSGDQSINEKTRVITKEVQPIRITVKEKPINGDLQSGNVRFQQNIGNGISERPGLPPPDQPQEENTDNEEPPKNFCGRLMGRFKTKTPKIKENKEPKEEKSNFLCCIKPKEQHEKEETPERINSDENLISEESANLKWYQKMCCKGNKVSDTTGCFPKAQRKSSWAAERADSIASENQSRKNKCKNFMKKIFCINLCTKHKKKEIPPLKRDSSQWSKKKSLTPSITIEEPKPKLDASLIEHMSLMKAAIPVMSVPLAWFCLILNVFVPGLGTIISGFLCLCTGKSRFSTEDGLKQRVGACVIDFFIGSGQLFTVLFCLVGWGWSVWWGVIMVKIARKYRKIRRVEEAIQEDAKLAEEAANENHLRDPERGS